jgi:hypothetical protein
MKTDDNQPAFRLKIPPGLAEELREGPQFVIDFGS